MTHVNSYRMLRKKAMLLLVMMTALVMVTFLPTAQSFAPTSTRIRTLSRVSDTALHGFSLQQLFGFPSRTETKAIVDPQRILELKANIQSLAKGTSNGISASSEVQSEISTLVQELETASSVPNLSSSDKLDGSWKLIYTTNGGSSAGKLGPFVGEVEQHIRITGLEEERYPYYINYVRLGGAVVEGALTATWDVLSKDKWQVNFESVTFKVFGIEIANKPLDATGIWRMSYLDDDFRILYAMGTNNAGIENIYILSK